MSPGGFVSPVDLAWFWVVWAVWVVPLACVVPPEPLPEPPQAVTPAPITAAPAASTRPLRHGSSSNLARDRTGRESAHGPAQVNARSNLAEVPPAHPYAPSMSTAGILVVEDDEAIAS